MSTDYTSKLAIGTVQLGLSYGYSNLYGQTSEAEAKEILDLAAASGIDMLDTAYLYGNSEEVVGKLAKGRFKIVSKWPAPDANNKLKDYLNLSLSRLQVSELYGWMSHRPDEMILFPKLHQEVIQFKNSGIIKNWGYSVYQTEQLHRLIDCFGYPDLVQLPYNLIDRRFEAMLPELYANGVSVHVRSAFFQGLLLMKTDELDSFFNPIKTWLTDFHQANPSEEQKISACLNFCLRNDDIDRVVMGLNKAEQLDFNLKALAIDFNLPDLLPNNLPEEIINPSFWPQRNV
ncbi:MAG: aldo/keto reductase [Bacteroidia bacterium]